MTRHREFSPIAHADKVNLKATLSRQDKGTGEAVLSSFGVWKSREGDDCCHKPLEAESERICQIGREERRYRDRRRHPGVVLLLSQTMTGRFVGRLRDFLCGRRIQLLVNIFNQTSQLHAHAFYKNLR